MKTSVDVCFTHKGVLCTGKIIGIDYALGKCYKVEWRSKVGKHIEWFNMKEVTPV